MNTVKSYTGIVISACMLFGMYACKKDSYAPPFTKFTGRIVYQNTPIGVKSNGAGTVYFELWQSGFGKSGAIDVQLSQDGSFSSLLFNGTYKLVIPASQGPWMSVENTQTNSDTIPLTLNGNQTMDIEIMPYYMIDNTNFQIAADSTVTASCSVSQIIKDANQKPIDFVALYVNRTSFVDDDNNIASSSIKGADITDLGSLNFTARIPVNINNGNISVANQNYFYVRIGVKIAGIDDMLFSNIQKVTLP